MPDVDQSDLLNTCPDCGKILEFRDSELEARKEQVARTQGFRLLSHSLKLLVECTDPNCPGRAAEAARPTVGGDA